MTTFGAVAVGIRAARTAKRNARRTAVAAPRLKEWLARLGEAAFSVAAAGCVDAAAFMFQPVVGMLTIGVSLLFLEWRMEDDTR